MSSSSVIHEGKTEGVGKKSTISMPEGAVKKCVHVTSKNFFITVKKSYLAKALSARPGSCQPQSTQFQ
jgi:hypothetical protein